MIDYVKNLLPRLIVFSDSLDKKSSFINKPWIFIDDDSNYHHYSFQEDGSLIMSINGVAEIGSWKYISGSKCLLIDRIKDKILLNQIFINDGLMFLKKEGTDDKPWTLINKNVIPDLDYGKYLKSIFIKKHNLQEFSATDKSKYYAKTSPDAYSGFAFTNNVEIFDENLDPVPSGFVINLKNKKLAIETGRISSVLYSKYYKTTENIIINVVHGLENEFRLGDSAFSEEGLKLDGLFRFKPKIADNIKRIEVSNGKMTRIDRGTDSSMLALLLVLLIIAILTLGGLVFSSSKHIDPTSQKKSGAVQKTSVNVENEVKDTTTAEIVTDTTISILASFSEDEVKNKVIELFAAINQRNFYKINGLLDKNLHEFYGNKNISSELAVELLRRTWGESINEFNISYSKDDMYIGYLDKISLEQEASVYNDERSIELTTGIIYDYKLLTTITFNKSLLIIGITNKILEKKRVESVSVIDSTIAN